jgi:hypothetical protein
MKKLPTLILLALTCIFQLNSASAQDACEKDRAKFCGQYRDNDPLRLYCLKSIESQISSACKASLRNIKGSADDFIYECGDDFDKFCSQTPRGRGRILECLRSHSKELDFECRKMVNMLPHHDTSK